MVDQKYASGYKKCRQLTMGGAIAHSVTHSQTFDTDFRSLEIELGTSHRKTHTLSKHSSYKQNTPFSPPSLHPDPSSPPTHPAKQKAQDFCMCSEAYSTVSVNCFPLRQGVTCRAVFKFDLSFRETFLLRWYHFWCHRVSFPIIRVPLYWAPHQNCCMQFEGKSESVC